MKEEYSINKTVYNLVYIINYLDADLGKNSLRWYKLIRDTFTYFVLFSLITFYIHMQQVDFFLKKKIILTNSKRYFRSNNPFWFTVSRTLQLIQLPFLFSSRCLFSVLPNILYCSVDCTKSLLVITLTKMTSNRLRTRLKLP